MESIGSRFARLGVDPLHRVSKPLVQEVVENDCTAIAFEKLMSVSQTKFSAVDVPRTSTPRRIQSRRTRYRCRRRCPLRSQRCAVTASVASRTKTTVMDRFECLKRGKELNTARDIGWRHSTGSRLVLDGPTSQLALNSGALSANGDYAPSALRG
jgi:hypothetical protein